MSLKRQRDDLTTPIHLKNSDEPPDKKKRTEVIDLTTEPDSDLPRHPSPPPPSPLPNDSEDVDDDVDETKHEKANVQFDSDDSGSDLDTTPVVLSDPEDDELSDDDDTDDIPEPLLTTATVATTTATTSAHTSATTSASTSTVSGKKVEDGKEVVLFQTVRGQGPSEPSVGSRPYVATEMVLDMVEHAFNLEVVEIIRLGDHVLQHGYECCHDVVPPTNSIFKCADCGIVAETIPHEWNEDLDTLETKSTRFAQLIRTFFSKPIDPSFS
jgi:hypothetical protein